MDTFAHAFETYISNGATPWSEALFLKSIELFAKSIRTAVHEPDNLNARMDMAVSCSLLVQRSVRQPRGAPCDRAAGQRTQRCTPRGTLAACIPQIIEWTIPFAQEKFAKVSEIFDPTIFKLTTEEKAKKLPEILMSLYKDIEISPTFGGYGLSKEEIPNAVDICFGGFQWDLGGHPKPISKEDAAELFLRCL